MICKNPDRGLKYLSRLGIAPVRTAGIPGGGSTTSPAPHTRDRTTGGPSRRPRSTLCEPAAPAAQPAKLAGVAQNLTTSATPLSVSCQGAGAPARGQARRYQGCVPTAHPTAAGERIALIRLIAARKKPPCKPRKWGRWGDTSCKEPG
ncbi:MAG: hypothetical protein KME26_28990 [Oscillatoria princeps RMCB-10]|nr:hypothetical protein [Oscillatoria princeps RMCB-10]